MRMPRRPRLLEQATLGGFILRMICVAIFGVIAFGIGFALYQMALQVHRHPRGWIIGYGITAVVVGLTFLTYRWDPDDGSTDTSVTTTTTPPGW